MKEKLAILGGDRVIKDEQEAMKTRWPIITQEDKDAVMAVLDSGTLAGLYVPQATALEEEFAKYLDAKYCIASNTGTASQHMAIAAAEIGPGDEVIMPSFTFSATAMAVLHHNAIPVFVDIDPKTFNIDVNKISEKITPSTRAIVPVHLNGLPADMDEINTIAKKHNLIVIEDAAQAQGAVYKGKKAGVLGDMASFSFNVSKNLSGGEGGMFVTNREEYNERARILWTFGERLKPGDYRVYDSVSIGWNYRTQELPAAFTRSQLKRLDSYNANAQKNAEYLSEHLKEIKGLTVPYIPPDRTCVFYMYRIMLNPEELGIDIDGIKFRDTLLKTLIAEGIEADLWHTIAVPAQIIFQKKNAYPKGCPWDCSHYKGDVKYNDEDFVETKKVLENSLVIGKGAYPLMSTPFELIKYYVEAIKKVFESIEAVEKLARN